MAIKKPKVLIVFAREASDASTKYGGFVKRLQKNGGFSYADVDYVALENLVFHIENKRVAQVYDPVTGIDAGDYSFVYLKSWQSMPELAASLALYLEGRGIPYADHQARHEYIAKTSNYMAMWAHGVSVPATTWGSPKVLQAYVSQREDGDFPLIIKAVHGQKGKDNYLAHSKAEALEILEGTQVAMLLQQFIPNEGDYRIGVYGNKSRWAIYRKSGGSSHLNNTSAGGTATEIPVSKVSRKIRTLAEEAAEACELSISGVDIVEDMNTKKLYVFEANQGSQIVTGAFVESNMAAFDEGIKSMISRRFKNGSTSRGKLRTIGRTTVVTIKTADGDLHFSAKADSGAFRSAVDASNIALLTDDAGKEYVQYELSEKAGDTRITMTTHEFEYARIMSSNGQEERRFVVPMVVEIAGKEYNTKVTLARRRGHKNQMLIGRQLLRGHFLINVELGL